MKFKTVENRRSFRVYQDKKVELKEDTFFKNTMLTILALGVVVFIAGHYIF